MRILITGKNGQVGTELSRLYHSRGDVVLTGRDECDLSNEQSIRDTVERVKPTVIINAGAYTAVDQAEKEPGLCFAINAHAPQVLAQEAARLGALLIHYSTDYVFNGEKAATLPRKRPHQPGKRIWRVKGRRGGRDCRGGNPLPGAPDQLGVWCPRKELSPHHAPARRRAS